MSTRTTLQEMAEAVLFEQAADWSVLPDVVANSSLISAYGTRRAVAEGGGCANCLRHARRTVEVRRREGRRREAEE